MSDERHLSIRIVMLPRDTNGRGTIFGGVILSHLDLAAGEAAFDYKAHRYVTAAMKEVEFIAPVYVGDIVSFYTKIDRVGRTSITVHVIVEAKRVHEPYDTVKVTEADVVFVAVDGEGRPIPVAGEPLGLTRYIGRA
ncbi:MAG: acyl-CoA thioesterase [Planctomycetes bacterium]|nr:acyl-CoA thioesterase [Planctomycetota bacterium]